MNGGSRVEPLCLSERSTAFPVEQIYLVFAEKNYCLRRRMLRRIIRSAMIDKAHLCDKKVIFRFRDEVQVYAGVVKVVESNGFWIESPQLIGQMAADSAWKRHVEQVRDPVLFVPTSSLMFLITTQE
jgi:hypothetical protein